MLMRAAPVARSFGCSVRSFALLGSMGEGVTWYTLKSAGFDTPGLVASLRLDGRAGNSWAPSGWAAGSLGGFGSSGRECGG
eukprot:2452422-Amphidinium_carterae.1